MYFSVIPGNEQGLTSGSQICGTHGCTMLIANGKEHVDAHRKEFHQEAVQVSYPGQPGDLDGNSFQVPSKLIFGFYL
jgi:hypothetical protein